MKIEKKYVTKVQQKVPWTCDPNPGALKVQSLMVYYDRGQWNNEDCEDSIGLKENGHNTDNDSDNETNNEDMDRLHIKTEDSLRKEDSNITKQVFNGTVHQNQAPAGHSQGNDVMRWEIEV